MKTKIEQCKRIEKNLPLYLKQTTYLPDIGVDPEVKVNGFSCPFKLKLGKTPMPETIRCVKI